MAEIHVNNLPGTAASIASVDDTDKIDQNLNKKATFPNANPLSNRRCVA